MSDQDDEKPRKRVLPYHADPAVDYRSASTSPGGLRGQAELLVQTRYAQKLVVGRGKYEKDDPPAIIGLIRFAMLMRRLWDASELDDPYADWYLLQTQENLEHGHEELKHLKQQIEQRLQGVQGVQITVAESHEPVRIPLHFANPYGYMGAYLISDYDQFARAVLTARHVGLLSRDESERMLHQNGGRLVRRAFSSAQGFKYCGVTRDDMAANNAKARAAIEAMGELPQEVLTGELRPRIRPEHRKKDARKRLERLERIKFLASSGTRALPSRRSGAGKSEAEPDGNPPGDDSDAG